MKKCIFSGKTIDFIRCGFLLGAFAISIIFSLHSDAADEINVDSSLAIDLSIEEVAPIKDPATGEEIPFSKLKSGNPKLSPSLNQLLAASQSSGKTGMKALAKERGIKLKEDLVQVVIEVNADRHQPLTKEILEELKGMILRVDGKFELDFHNLLQVLLPVDALEEVARWPGLKFVREPFRPHPIKDSRGAQYKEDAPELLPSIQMDEGCEAEIPLDEFQENIWGECTSQQGGLIIAQPGKDCLDTAICPRKNIEKYSPDPSTYEQIPQEEAKGYENFPEAVRGLKMEKVYPAQADAEIRFCTEYDCASITVTLGEVPHSSSLNCSNIISFSSVPAGTYSLSISGCGFSWSTTIEVSGGYVYNYTICPPSGVSDCCPIGCGELGSFLCERCGALNLTPYKPSGWSDKIVVSTTTGDNVDDSPLYDTDVLYIDFAVLNSGGEATAQTYYNALYVDDVQVQTSFEVSPPHEPSMYFYSEDYSIGALPYGTHTIKVAADYDNRIPESNETDNEYTKTITILSSGLPYQPVTSEGVSLVGSDDWQDAGFTGQGVKIAVIDSGFKNYDSLLGLELPDAVTTKFYGSGEDIYEYEHGTACAEIIHDMAPDALVFLTQPRTDVELGDAVNWCINQGVQVISYSIGWSIINGPLDGTGPINDIVNQAVNNGITWVNAVGNEAKAHWSGDFYDLDDDGLLNFSGADEINQFLTLGDQPVFISMIWNDPWGSSNNDYDLLVLRADDLSLVAYSAETQDGDDDPREAISFIPQSGISYGVAIQKASGSAKNIHVKMETQNPLLYYVPATSLCIPADNPNVIAVGAVAWNMPSELEDFSSQGPTTDGRIKPDVAAPDQVSASHLTYGAYQTTGGFGGTSASCPHVAGACAQTLQAQPGFTPSEVRGFLESRALDKGVSGRDNEFGSGLIHLGVPPPTPYRVLFPHIDTTSLWRTEIAIINTSSTQTANGALRAFSNTGQLIDTIPLSLAPHARREVTISQEFTDHASIGYLIFETDSDTTCGYTKFYVSGQYRVAVPAVKEVNTSDIYLSHIDSSDQWWTGVSLLNTTDSAKTLTLSFDTGQSKTLTLAAKEHQAFTIKSLFNDQFQPDINSAVITNASGIVGLELFGSGNQLSGILIKDATASTIYYPHVASDEQWWTGIVAFNPSASPSTLTITPYTEVGTALATQTIEVPAGGKYIGTVSALSLPPGTAWLKIDSTNPLTGFELFGTTNGNQLAGYTGVGISGKEGVFAKTEKAGWTGIAFVNIEGSTASVTLTAYDNYGNAVATETLSLGSYAKIVDIAENIFSGKDISAATYIGYASDREIVGFQLNGTWDGMLLDGLPGM
jgi:hypothetical protein